MSRTLLLLSLLASTGCRSSSAVGTTAGAGESPGAPPIVATGDPKGGGSEGAGAAAPDPWFNDARWLARVSGRAITLREIKYRLGGTYDRLLADREQLRQLVDLKLQDLVVERLLEEEAKRVGIGVPEDVFEGEVAEWERQAAARRTTLEQSIREQGRTRREWEQDLRSRLLVQRFIYLATGRYGDVPREFYRLHVDPYVSPEEIRAYGERHPEESSVPEKAVVRMIDLRPDDFSEGGRLSEDEAWEACGKAMDRAEARVHSGEDFGKVAGEVSKGEGSDREGLLEPFDRRSQRPRAIVDWAFREDVKQGGLSPRVRLPSGYMLLRLESRTEAHRAPIEEWGAKARERLLGIRREIAFQGVVRRLVEAASIAPETLQKAILADCREQVRKLEAEAR